MQTPARWLAAGILLLSGACGSAAEATFSTPAAQASTTAAAQAWATTVPANPPGAALAPGSADVARAFQHIEHLAVVIGSRAAGTSSERAAAEYIANTLGDAGYETAIEPFEFEAPFDESSVTLGGEVTVDAFVLEGAPASGGADAGLAYAGTGSAGEVDPASLRGQIALIDRGLIPFAQKVRTAEEAGAVGVIIVNNEPGPYRGTLGSYAPTIPVLGVALEERPALIAAAGLGAPVELAARAGTQRSRSQNVAARVSDECWYYLGAHYDSVPEGPGANDNASGVAVILELARIYRTEGLCVVAFGAEEVGLWGSRAYVSQHLAGGARFMLNVDMAGKLEEPIIVGDRSLTRSILGILAKREADSSLRAGVFPPFASSDHVSFTAVGVPAVTLNAGGDDQFIHTPADDITNVDVQSLAVMLDAAGASLRGLIDSAPPR